MNLKDYAAHDALGLAQLVKNKEVTAAELLDCALQASEALNGDLNAIVRSMEAEARAAIAAGVPAGPFEGVPLPAQGLDPVLRRCADRLRQPLLQGLDPRFRQRNGGAVEAGRRGDLRQDQHAGGRFQRLHGAGGERSHP